MESGFTLALDLDPEQALLSGKVQTLVVCVYENERPHGGLLGRLDWRFRGLISEFLAQGKITGALGGCVLLPVGNQTLLAVGCGVSDSPGVRKPLAAEWKDTSLKRLQSNLSLLKRDRVALSMSDFGLTAPESLSSLFRGIPLWIVE